MTLKTDNYQIGLSSDPLKNFTLRTPATPDGSMIISRGNADNPGATILTINPQGAIVLPDGTYVGGNGRRNKLRNGNGRINQRTITSGSTGGIWIADGWVGDAAVSGITTTVANNFANNPSRTGGVALGMQNGASVKSTLASTDALGISQKIEGLDCADLLWGTADARPVTISFRAYASQATVVPVSIRNGAVNRGYVTTVALLAGFNSYSVTIPGDTTGTWATDINAFGSVAFYGAVGTGYTAAAANTWSAGNVVGCPGMSNICDTASRYFVISDVQLEAGTVATPYDWRDYGEELRRCQRYFEVGIFEQLGYANASAAFGGRYSFKAAKRATPTIAQIANASGFVIVNTGSTSSYRADMDGVTIYRTATAAGNIQFSETFSASSEL